MCRIRSVGKVGQPTGVTAPLPGPQGGRHRPTFSRADLPLPLGTRFRRLRPYCSRESSDGDGGPLLAHRSHLVGRLVGSLGRLPRHRTVRARRRWRCHGHAHCRWRLAGPPRSPRGNDCEARSLRMAEAPDGPEAAHQGLPRETVRRSGGLSDGVGAMGLGGQTIQLRLPFECPVPAYVRDVVAVMEGGRSSRHSLRRPSRSRDGRGDELSYRVRASALRCGEIRGHRRLRPARPCPTTCSPRRPIPDPVAGEGCPRCARRVRLDRLRWLVQERSWIPGIAASRARRGRLDRGGRWHHVVLG